ncbi:MAG: hypothetical protein E7579_04530 [Ruminococcaceae bacterium]|nr:hypothetical protein [Oscillospiraceae bacterium]
MKRIFPFILTVVLLTACGNRMPEGVPQDFAVYYADWINESQPDILDTYEGYIQKDLIMDGTAKTDYTPSEEEITAIYDKIVELELWKMPDNMRAEAEVIQPMTYMEIRFTMNGKTYEILADTTVFHGYNENIEPEEAETVGKFCMFMQQFMMDTDEYQSLPESRGGYQ